jgi:hypothetical protein
MDLAAGIETATATAQLTAIAQRTEKEPMGLKEKEGAGLIEWRRKQLS